MAVRDDGFPEKFLVIEGHRLGYIDAGKGPTILFLHGLGSNHGCWQATLQEFAKSHRVIAYGQHPPCSIPRFTQTLREVTQQLHLHNFYLVGHSIGGAVVLDYLASQPQAVRGAMVVAPADTYQHNIWQRLMRLLRFQRPLHTSLLRRLSGIHVPLAIVWGERDNRQPVQLALDLHQQIPSAQLTIIPECGHFPMLECPEEFHRVLHHFLADQNTPYESCEDHLSPLHSHT